MNNDHRATRIALIGAGRLATNLGVALQKAGHEIVQVYSRSSESAQDLACRLQAEPINDLSLLKANIEVCFIAVKDSVLANVIAAVCKEHPDTLFFHTAGSMPLSVFHGYAQRYGVFYPMQTFSKERIVDFSRIPVFIEANCDSVLSTARSLATSISGDVRELSTEDRRYLHLSAVFACNFANHCYAMAAQLLEAHGLPFSVMLPLIEETLDKVHVMSPYDAQTGPAVRYDENVIAAQQTLLAENPDLLRIYNEMTRNIHKLHTEKNDKL